MQRLVFSGKTVAAYYFTVIVLILIIYFYLMRIPSEKHFGFTQWNRHSVFAGAIGNFIDRVTQRYVVDFFYFRLINFPGVQRRRHLCDRCCRTFDLMSVVL